MPIIEPAIRPPAEAGSFLLQVTTGCSSNSCEFCGAYLNKPFAVKPLDEIYQDIEDQRLYDASIRRVFLMDGDALVLNNTKLIPILQKLQDSFPQLTRISSYANGYNITQRSEHELHELTANKLRLIYLGLESGSQEILEQMQKRSSVEEMIKAVHKAYACKIKASVMVLLGLGGKQYYRRHVENTIQALNEMQPRYLSFLSLMIIPGTVLAQKIQEGKVDPLNTVELLQQTYDIIKGLKLYATVFRCNHASNYLPLEGRFPQDKDVLLKMLRNVIEESSIG